MPTEPDRTRVLALHLTKPSNSEASVLSSLLRELEDNITVDLVVNNAGDSDAASHFRDFDELANISVNHMNIGLPVDPWKPDSAWQRLLARSTHPVRRPTVTRLARNRHVDVVYTSQQRFDCRIGERVSKKLGIPHVVHLHYLPGPWLRSATMLRLKTCDHVIAISDFIAHRAIEHGVAPERISVIHNSIVIPQLRKDRRHSDSSIVIGQTGRMEPGKGFPETVQVFAMVHSRHPSTRLLLVGEGSERSDVEHLIRRLGLEEAVELTGWREDIDVLLQGMDIFVNPSRQEPFGLNVLEAMSHELPVVAYGDAGVAELVSQHVTGALVSPGATAAMADAICQLVDDPAMRLSYGQAAVRRVGQDFSPVKAGAEFSSVLRDTARHPTGERN